MGPRVRIISVRRHSVATVRRETVGYWMGAIAVSLAVPSAFLTSALFTPAIAAIVITLPLGLVALLMKAWRTGSLAIYWALTSILALPNVSNTALLSVLLLLAYLVGILAIVVLTRQYCTRNTPSL